MVSAKPQINQLGTTKKRERRNECCLWQGKENQRVNSMLSWNKEILGILSGTLLCFYRKALGGGAGTCMSMLS